MEKKQVTEEMRPEIFWFEKAKHIKTPQELTEFAKELFDDTGHDYGTVCHAIGAFALAAAWMAAYKEGITGFQAGFVMWDFVRHWMYPTNMTGMKLVDYDNMLYPQYDYKFEKTISSDIWEGLQSAAKKKLEENSEEKQGYTAHPEVVKHWQSIVDGKIPFGFTISDD